MLEVKDLCVEYLYGARAIDSLSFRVENGEVLAVLADDEGGKTSLIKAICGITSLKSGKIFLNEAELTNKKPKERNVSAVFENEGIFRFRSVKFNLEYPLKMRKIAKNERKKRILEAANKYSIYPNLADLASQLYEDDLVRLKFARTEVRQSDLILFDNPFENLKGNLRERLFLELLPNIRRANCPVIFATNSLDEALAVADKIIVLKFGILIEDGTPKEILEKSSIEEFKRKLFSDYKLEN